MNQTDARILKLWSQGCSIPRIAARIGRPNDLARVREAISRDEAGRALAIERGIKLEDDLQEETR